MSKTVLFSHYVHIDNGGLTYEFCKDDDGELSINCSNCFYGYVGNSTEIPCQHLSADDVHEIGMFFVKASEEMRKV